MALRQPVVVKFHEDGFVGGGARAALERFLREARTLSSIRHRNVCELFEVGQTDDGEPYFVMERLRGRTLAARLRQDVHLPFDEALEVAVAVTRGLEAVHGAGVLHRDVKPENIFLHEGELGVVPKLIDFGLARLSGGKRITSGGRAVGTPGYMAPEQARGEGDLDRRADLYALGVTLYEMLCGELPSRGETMVDLMVWTATELPIPLSDWRPELRGPVEDAVMRALEPEREERYPDARAMRRALEALASTACAEPVAARASGVRGREASANLPPPGSPGDAAADLPESLRSAPRPPRVPGKKSPEG
jgi:serine/threonine-protein kinase